jgi:hypothetical protein
MGMPPFVRMALEDDGEEQAERRVAMRTPRRVRISFIGLSWIGALVIGRGGAGIIPRFSKNG